MGPESRLEARCNALARGRGCHTIKLGGFAVGLPDRLYLLPGGQAWLVEFKSLTGTISPAQKYLFGELAKLGHRVEVIRSAAVFECLLCERVGAVPPRRAQIGA